MIVLIAIGLAIALLVLRRLRRRARAERRGAAETPQHIRIVEPDRSGPRHHRFFRGTDPGNLGAGGSGGPVLYRLRRVWWAALGAVMNRGDQMRQVIKAMGVVVLVGPNGSGKSLLAVEAVIAEMGLPWRCEDLDHRHNRAVRDHCDGCAACSRVPGEVSFCHVASTMLDQHGVGLTKGYSTLELLDHRTGRVHPHYEPLTSLRQLPFIEHAVVLFDEVEEVAGADQSARMPGALKRWLKQLRKRDVLLFVTTPGYDACAKPIRSIAKLVIDCRSFYAVDSSTGRRWRPRLANLFVGYDAFEFGTFDKASGKRLPALARLYYWRPSNVGQHSYNTLAQVHSLSEVDETGACVVCNGSRSTPKCGCDPAAAEIHPDDLVIETVEGPRGGVVRKGVRRSARTEGGGVPEGVPPSAGPAFGDLQQGAPETLAGV